MAQVSDHIVLIDGGELKFGKEPSIEVELEGGHLASIDIRNDKPTLFVIAIGDKEKRKRSPMKNVMAFLRRHERKIKAYAEADLLFPVRAKRIKDIWHGGFADKYSIKLTCGDQTSISTCNYKVDMRIFITGATIVDGVVNLKLRAEIFRSGKNVPRCHICAHTYAFAESKMNNEDLDCGCGEIHHPHCHLAFV